MLEHSKNQSSQGDGGSAVRGLFNNITISTLSLALSIGAAFRLNAQAAVAEEPSVVATFTSNKLYQKSCDRVTPEMHAEIAAAASGNKPSTERIAEIKKAVKLALGVPPEFELDIKLDPTGRNQNGKIQGKLTDPISRLSYSYEYYDRVGEFRVEGVAVPFGQFKDTTRKLRGQKDELLQTFNNQLGKDGLRDLSWIGQLNEKGELKDYPRYDKIACLIQDALNIPQSYDLSFAAEKDGNVFKNGILSGELLIGKGTAKGGFADSVQFSYDSNNGTITIDGTPVLRDQVPDFIKQTFSNRQDPLPEKDIVERADKVGKRLLLVGSVDGNNIVAFDNLDSGVPQFGTVWNEGGRFSVYIGKADKMYPINIVRGGILTDGGTAVLNGRLPDGKEVYLRIPPKFLNKPATFNQKEIYREKITDQVEFDSK